MTVNIHASCVTLGRAGSAFGAPDDTGVLLLGESGAGKSDLALRLIELGASLVSDDRTELYLETGVLMARPPQSLAGLLEVRGVGILELPYEQQVRVTVAVILIREGTPERLPRSEFYEPPGALACPQAAWPRLFRLAALEPSAPAKIAAMAAAIRSPGRETAKS